LRASNIFERFLRFSKNHFLKKEKNILVYLRSNTAKKGQESDLP
jgi:hypothetical protein